MSSIWERHVSRVFDQRMDLEAIVTLRLEVDDYETSHSRLPQRQAVCR